MSLTTNLVCVDSSEELQCYDTQENVPLVAIGQKSQSNVSAVDTPGCPSVSKQQMQPHTMVPNQRGSHMKRRNVLTSNEELDTVSGKSLLRDGSVDRDGRPNKSSTTRKAQARGEVRFIVWGVLVLCMALVVATSTLFGLSFSVAKEQKEVHDQVFADYDPSISLHVDKVVQFFTKINEQQEKWWKREENERISQSINLNGNDLDKEALEKAKALQRSRHPHREENTGEDQGEVHHTPYLYSCHWETTTQEKGRADSSSWTRHHVQLVRQLTTIPLPDRWHVTNSMYYAATPSARVAYMGQASTPLAEDEVPGGLLIGKLTCKDDLVDEFSYPLMIKLLRVPAVCACQSAPNCSCPLDQSEESMTTQFCPVDREVKSQGLTSHFVRFEMDEKFRAGGEDSKGSDCPRGEQCGECVGRGFLQQVCYALEPNWSQTPENHNIPEPEQDKKDGPIWKVRKCSSDVTGSGNKSGLTMAKGQESAIYSFYPSTIVSHLLKGTDILPGLVNLILRNGQTDPFLYLQSMTQQTRILHYTPAFDADTLRLPGGHAEHSSTPPLKNRSRIGSATFDLPLFQQPLPVTPILKKRIFNMAALGVMMYSIFTLSLYLVLDKRFKKQPQKHENPDDQQIGWEKEEVSSRWSENLSGTQVEDG